ncbi:hypothetical protein [Burkholderia ubonensis]|uniref:hypothetical protein n=1 Tax=Burkholderia ubonensis TaxID=101571 RepID=UPI00076D937A|nr:hypothetical protein [Burkholderia ubonensis]KVW44763.1 hypothetical protein WK95_10480 [Burkholderia ubonensis]
MPHDKVDWRQAPKSAVWWAMDESGAAHWYCAPDVAPFTNFWYADQQPASSFDYHGDYRASLTERPVAVPKYSSARGNS